MDNCHRVRDTRGTGRTNKQLKVNRVGAARERTGVGVLLPDDCSKAK